MSQIDEQTMLNNWRQCAKPYHQIAKILEKETPLSQVIIIGMLAMLLHTFIKTKNPKWDDKKVDEELIHGINFARDTVHIRQRALEELAILQNFSGEVMGGMQ